MRSPILLPSLVLVLCSTLIVSLPVCCNAQVKWPQITQQTKPWARWWWEGSEVNNKDLTAVMEKYQKAGLGGLEITPIYGVRGDESQFIDFLSDKWMSVFEHTLQEGQRLGLGIDLANATGWPFGGPWVKEADASKELCYKAYSIKEGQRFADKITFIQEPLVRAEGGSKVDISQVKRPLSLNKNLQALALDQIRFEKSLPLITLMAYNGDKQSLELTNKVDKVGVLHWQAPIGSGNWQLYAVFQGQHGKMVERAAPGGEGLVIDHFSKTALKHYLERFDQAFQGKNLQGLRAFFNDSYEVDDARGQADFTPELFEEFRSRRGYDLKDYLPYLLSNAKDEKSLRVLADFRTTIGELLLAHFTQPWESWAKGQHKIIRNQSHGSPANILDLYGAIDIPETEGEDRLRFKFASSAAHVLGKPLVSSESATWLKDHFLSSLGDVKAAMDLYFLGGVNHTFYHGIAYSPLSAPWPGRLFYAAVHFSPSNPQWQNFSTLNAYIARCQSFLQQGSPDNQILQYFPLDDSYQEKGRAILKHYDGMNGFEGTAFQQNAQWMLDKGYGFDFISDLQITKLTAQGDVIISPGGSYKTILLSDVHYIPVATMDKILQLVESGGRLIVYKRLPSDVPGLGQLDKRRGALKRLLEKIRFTGQQTGVQSAKLGKGDVLLGNDLEALLDHAAIQREPMTDLKLDYTRRKIEQAGNDKYYYFITNHSGGELTQFVPLTIKGKGAFLYNPMTEKAGKAVTKTDAAGHLSVFLSLEPGESLILESSVVTAKGNSYPYLRAKGQPITLSGKWTLDFKDGGPQLPASRTLNSLSYWTDLQDSILDRYAGEGVYATEFPKPDLKTENCRITLGEVHENAEIWLNGHKLGDLLGPVYQLDFPTSLLQASNHLEIRVSSLMANRIRYMDQHHLNYKIFYNTNFPAHDAVNRGPDGLFTAAGWSVLPAGLKGPVSLTALGKIDNFQEGVGGGDRKKDQ